MGPFLRDISGKHWNVVGRRVRAWSVGVIAGLVAVLVPISLAMASGGDAAAQTSGSTPAANSASQPNSLSEGLAEAVQQLRGSEDVEFNATPTSGFGSVEGTDSQGAFTLSYNQIAAGTPITGVIIGSTALGQAIVDGGSIPATEFTLDPSTFTVTSSRSSSLRNLGGSSIAPPTAS